MLELTSPFVLWPVGIALGGLLFFEIAKRSLRVDPAPRVVEARSKALKRGNTFVPSVARALETLR